MKLAVYFYFKNTSVLKEMIEIEKEELETHRTLFNEVLKTEKSVIEIGNLFVKGNELIAIRIEEIN